jgi:FKBP-type peptidyl-prolyl cis-trans isomerase
MTPDMTLKLAVVVGVGLLAAPGSAGETQGLTSEKEKLSYSIGVQTARNFKKDDVAVDMDLLVKGLKDGLSGEKLLLPEKELRTVLQAFQNELRRKMVLNQRVLAADNRKKGFDFLSANREKAGVVTLPSGVQYRILKSGDGKKPTDADMVECTYRGTLLDGTEFDGTEPGKSANLKVAQLIAGWKEALMLMPVGSRWQVFVPSQLAYGERGRGGEIGPNETVIFEVELVAVK